MIENRENKHERMQSSFGVSLIKFFQMKQLKAVSNIALVNYMHDASSSNKKYVLSEPTFHSNNAELPLCSVLKILL